MRSSTYGIIGCGRWGLRLLQVLQRMGVPERVHHVADLDPRRGQAAAELFPGRILHPDAASLLARPELTGVLIATPTPTHGDLVEAALERGLDVYVEKVVSVDPGQASRIQARARDEGAILQLGLPWQHGPVADALRADLGEGRLGELRGLWTERRAVEGQRREEGVLWDLLPHDLAVALDLFTASPAAVRVHQARRDGGLLVAAEVELALRDGVRCRMGSSWVASEAQRRWRILGERGEAVVEEAGQRRTLRVSGEERCSDRLEPLEEALLEFLSGARRGGAAGPAWAAQLTHLLAAIEGAADRVGEWLPLGSGETSAIAGIAAA